MKHRNLDEIRIRAETLQGEGYWTHSCTQTTACAGTPLIAAFAAHGSTFLQSAVSASSSRSSQRTSAQASNDIYAACVDMRPIIYR